MNERKYFGLCRKKKREGKKKGEGEEKRDHKKNVEKKSEIFVYPLGAKCYCAK
jgi:hypothetical protein